MSVGIQFDLKNLDKVQKRIQKQVEIMKNTKTPMVNVATVLFQSVIQNFREQGTDKEKWEPLSLITLFVKKYRKSKPTSKPTILQDTGMLRNSIHPEVGDDYAKVGTNLDYARLHQFGGVSSPSEVIISSHWRTRHATGKKYKVSEYILRFKGGHKIPARPFLTIRETHKNRILDIISRWFFGKE